MRIAESTTDNAVAKIKEQFSFTVDKFPLFGPDNMPTDQYGLFHSNDGYLPGVKSVSQHYVPHTTDDVVAITEAASEVFDGQISAKCHFNNGHYVALAPTDQTRRDIFNVTNGDNVFPRFMVRGGFDGRGFKAQIGYYRDLCRNLSMLESVEEFSRSIRHTSGLRWQMNDLITTFSQLKNSWASMTELIAAMNQKTVDMREFLEAIYGEPDDDASGRAITTHKKRTKRIMDRLWDELSQTNQTFNAPATNAWFAFNAIQGYEQHDAVRRGINTLNQDFERVLRAGNSHVRSAEKLALAA